MQDAPYQQLQGDTMCLPKQLDSDIECFSDTGQYTMQKKPIRTAKKRADIKATMKEKYQQAIESAGTVWGVCLASEVNFADLLLHWRKGLIDPNILRIESTYSEVLICRVFNLNRATVCFVFRFGCVVGWDIGLDYKQRILGILNQFLMQPIEKPEFDDMNYVWSQMSAIRQDNIHLVTSNTFEQLAYSYAFAQSCKLAVFENVVEATIDSTKAIPEGLSKTGTIQSNREEISKRIGELFINRFYINLHTDILDTPDIFWEFDEFADHYSSCRSYLEIPKRVEILNQRLDIIKDLYDMLHNELTIQHGYKLEWIVIYLICIEVIIEVFWNIIIKDILRLV